MDERGCKISASRGAPMVNVTPLTGRGKRSGCLNVYQLCQESDPEPNCKTGPNGELPPSHDKWKALF